MAASADSRHRSRLIREMARDLNRHDHSCASSTGSHHGTVSDDSTMDFDPENEAIMSTRQMVLNISQRLPELRDTAKKYGRWNGGRQQTNDFVINTSAIGRAFPDFSQGGSSDESSFHVEVGRGARTKQRAPSRIPQTEYSDNIDSPVVSIGDFKILSTPPSKGQSKHRQDSLRGSIGRQSKGASTPQKENIPPSVPSATKLPNYVSGATRSSSGEQRRTLAEIHARVADDSDGSFISDERPATVTFQPKQSRFSAAQPKGSPLAAIHNIPQQQIKNALADALSRHREEFQQTPRPQNNATQNSNTANQTNQSFLLPNMPDLSELVSGSFKDGTPVFTRSGKVQSRFTSSSGRTPPGPGHVKLDNVPVPDEEKAIFISLQLLQDKVAMLEMEKADAQRVAQNLQDDNYQLQSENAQLQKHRRSDSALGMGDSGSDGEYGKGNKNIVAEKTKIEAQFKSLQIRYSEIERKSSNQELRLKTVSFERDQAAKQLAEAYYTTEQLQSENDALRSENGELKLELARLSTDSEENTRQWRQKETGLRAKISRREAAVTELREMTQEIQEARLANTAGIKARKPTAQKQQTRKEPNNPRSSTRGRVQAAEKQEPARLRSRSRSQSRHTQSRHAKSYVEEETFDIPAAGSTNEDFDASDEGSFDDVTKTVHKDLNIHAEDATQGSNYSSILGHGEMDRLREMLANERARNAELCADRDHTSHSVKSSRSVKSIRAAQGLTGILKNRNSGKADQDNTSHSNVSHTRRHSETSIKAQTAARHITTEDVTSAFIIPDITLSVAMNGGHPTLSAKAKKVLDTLCHHDGGNCTVCTRVASFEQNVEGKQTVSIQKPIPVSDRMPVAGPYEDEPTMRPSVAPGLALATVMKGLEDELAHLKIELAQYQAVYNKHDPSLSMRKRKAVKARIERLLKAIDTKADQIYALYDVLEGQKETGQELSEKEVEVTLMDIGIDVDALKKDQTEQDLEGEDSGEDSELDLPWEGIEDTTGSNSVNGRRRSWVAYDMYALTGCSGKLGGAVLNAILTYDLILANELVICTSSNPSDAQWDSVKSQGAQVRQSNYDDQPSMEDAYSGCTKLVLVSSPRISMDFNNAPHGEGREKHHFAAIDAARKAGVDHIYYLSLAFGSNSKAGVMRAHNRTEAYLYGLKDVKFTVIREGLYNESWPLYFGNYFKLKDDDRKEVVVAGDGPINWTPIRDLGYATALVAADSSSKYEGKTLNLSASTATTLAELAKTVSEVKGTEVSLKVVSREEYVRYYVEDMGMERGNVEWWSTSYDALKSGECHITDSTFSDLLSKKGCKPRSIQETVKAMLG
ncbi:hypothetical protein V490_00675 [Pseudogymnoascus sp. VKM F-3557]|nr:hypothetical protein V490_00675 [Pseudogymnoascus sp. VKM F-3557]